jgi:hypothetical protein
VIRVGAALQHGGLPVANGSLSKRQLILLGIVGGGGGFSPSSLAGLVAWFAPASGQTVTTEGGSTPSTNGDPVGQWANRAAPANPLRQATTADRPALIVSGGNSLIRCDQTGGLKSLTFASNPMGTPTAAYLAIRIKRTSGNGEYAHWTSNADDNASYIDLGNTNYESFGTTTRRVFANGGAFAAVGGGVLEVAATGASWTAWINGTQAFTAGTNTLPVWQAAPTVGATGPNQVSLIGDIYGLILCTAIPSVDQRASVRTYLGGL